MTYGATVEWSLGPEEDFLAGRYSRGHRISFDGGAVLPASASPHIVGRWAVPEAIDPEEMLVAALSSCHMLVFLHEARNAGFRVTAYTDTAEGVMEEIAPGRQAVTRVTLRPHVAWTGAAPDAETLAGLHEAAHHGCFIANSVRTVVTIEPA